MMPGRGGRRCPICGVERMACGTPTTCLAVDARPIHRATTSGARQRYRVRVHGTDTVLNLTAADAHRLYPDAVPLDAVQT